jgi:hypothetical protein
MFLKEAVYPRGFRVSLSRVVLPIVLAVFVSADQCVHAQFFFREILNPKTYRSPSGAYAIAIDPSDRRGAGKASYRLTHFDKLVWAKQLPFTLWKAGVTDKGEVGGFAYSDGKDSSRGVFRIVLLDPQGKLRLDEATPREDTLFPDGHPNPTGKGVFLDSGNDRMVVRVAHEQKNEGWWTYRLSDGHAASKYEPWTLMPDRETSRFFIDARPVPGTPLTILHSWRFDGPPSGPQLGSRFSLINLQGKSVWHLDLPNDFNVGDKRARDRVEEEVRRDGAILPTDRRAQFEVRCVAKAERVRFEITAGMKGDWIVREIERRPYSPPGRQSRASPPAIPERPLKFLGSFILQSNLNSPRLPIRSVLAFEIDGAGCLAFLRKEDSGALTLVRVSQDGKLLNETRLPESMTKPFSRYPKFAWVGGNRFVLVNSLWEGEARSAAWWVDANEGKVTSVDGFDCPAIRAITGTRDGGFVVLASEPRSQSTTAYQFDSRGRRAWALPTDDGRRPECLFSPEAIAITTNDQVAVLDHIRKDIAFFDRAGKYLKTLPLKAAMGREPAYAAGLVADAHGGLVFRDSGGKAEIVRLNADGTLGQQLTAAYPDGRTSSGLQEVNAAPDGCLWTTDGEAILRLSPDGKVDRVLGNKPNPFHLHEISAVALDHRGRVYALSSRTWAVHVFDDVGRRLHVCVPNPRDFEINHGSPDLAVKGTGEVFLAETIVGDGYLHFSPEGKRLGFVRGKTGRETWRFQPGNDRRWILTGDDVHLVEGEDRVIRSITRRPDGDWLAHPRHAAVSDDGSVAVFEEPSTLESDPGPAIIDTYTKDGDPRKSIPLPINWSVYGRFAYDGEHLIVVVDSKVVILDASGKPVQQFTVPHAEDKELWWRPFIWSKGKSLLLFDGKSTMYRYSLP